MKKSIKNNYRMSLLAGALILGAALVPGIANATFIFQFDENGNGVVLAGTGAGPITGSLLADPSNPGHSALTYLLPEIVGNGDVFVYDDADRVPLGSPRVINHQRASALHSALTTRVLPLMIPSR